MHSPPNKLQRHIVRWLVNWRPRRPWVDDIMEDAKILVQETQRILPYVVPAYHRLQHKVKLRDTNRLFEYCLRNEAVPNIMFYMREWLLNCPFLKKPLHSVVNPATGNVVYKAQLRCGEFDYKGNPVVSNVFELSTIIAQYRYWIASDHIRDPRVVDLYGFVSRWGRPDYIILPIGKDTEKYAFVAPDPNNGVSDD
jgi:hypothetical protein